MAKAKAAEVASAAVALLDEGHSYAEMDCQAFVEKCVGNAGGKMAYAGSNAMARSVSWLGTLENAKADGHLVPGALLFIHEDDESGLPAKYKGDGLGDFSHVGVYIGDSYGISDEDKNGKTRKCSVVHSSASMARVAGSTLKNGWTHVGWMPEIDYGVEVQAGVTLGASVSGEDTIAVTDEATAHTATVRTLNGGVVKLRMKPSKSCGNYRNVAVGTTVTVHRTEGSWSLITAQCTDGSRLKAWMLSEFLK